jgi:putative ABC transport system permease protein
MTWNDRIESTRQDAAFAVRQLRRSPTFAITAIITLALGIGANASMFGVVDRLLLQPPAQVVEPARVVTAAVEIGRAGSLQSRLSYPIYRDLKRSTGAFSDVGAFDNAGLPVGEGASATIIPVVKATAGYFRALGVRPALGRFFTDDESERDPGARVIVLGDAYWRQYYAGDPAMIGKMIPVGGESFRVIGVAPAGFVGLDLAEVSAWIPLTVGSPSAFGHWQQNRQWYTLNIVARLRPGIGPDAAAAAGTASLEVGEAEDGLSASDIRERNERLRLTSALPRDARGSRPEGRVAVLVAIVSLLVLIIACANVANLQLARAIQRRREVAIRIALGVSRGRLLRQLALDGLIISLFGAAGALMIVAWSGAFVRRILLAGASAQVSPVNWRVLAFTAVVAIVTGVATGLIPALQATRAEPSDTLRAGGRGSLGGTSRARFTLIALQAAFTVVLLVGTVLFVRSLQRIESVPLGLDASHLLQIRLSTGGVQYPVPELTRDYERLQRAAEVLPEVSAAELANVVPFGATTSIEVTLPGRDSASVVGPYFYGVGSNYFQTIGTPMIAGRSFAASDRSGSSPVAIVNQTAAKRWWPGENPIGKCAHVGGDSMPCAEIVGVAANSRRQRIVEDESAVIYTPMGQGPSWATPNALLIRTRRPANEVNKAVVAELRALVTGVPAFSGRALSDALDPQMHSWKLGATMFGLFALLAIVLAAVGLYGVMAYDVSARTTEIGVRMALGARGGDIRRLVVLRAARVVAIGAVGGFVIAVVAGPRVGALLFRTSPYEPAAFIVTVVVLATVSLGATLIPAMRAAGVPPSDSLRAG